MVHKDVKQCCHCPQKRRQSGKNSRYRRPERRFIVCVVHVSLPHFLNKFAHRHVISHLAAEGSRSFCET